MKPQDIQEKAEAPIGQDYFFPEHGKTAITIRAASMEEALKKLEEIKNKK